MNAPAPPPHALLMQMLQGKIVSKAITAVAELGVADHMRAEPTPVAELVRVIPTESPSSVLEARAA